MQRCIAAQPYIGLSVRIVSSYEQRFQRRRWLSSSSIERYPCSHNKHHVTAGSSLPQYRQVSPPNLLNSYEELSALVSRLAFTHVWLIALPRKSFIERLFPTCTSRPLEQSFHLILETICQLLNRGRVPATSCALATQYFSSSVRIIQEWSIPSFRFSFLHISQL
jgi:hypothetical protein